MNFNVDEFINNSMNELSNLDKKTLLKARKEIIKSGESTEYIDKIIAIKRQRERKEQKNKLSLLGLFFLFNISSSNNNNTKNKNEKNIYEDELEEDDFHYEDLD